MFSPLVNDSFVLFFSVEEEDSNPFYFVNKCS